MERSRRNLRERRWRDPLQTALKRAKVTGKAVELAGRVSHLSHLLTFKNTFQITVLRVIFITAIAFKHDNANSNTSKSQLIHMVLIRC